MQNLHLPVRRASRRARIPGTTSRRCGRRLASAGPQEPGTVRKKNRKSQFRYFFWTFCSDNIKIEELIWYLRRPAEGRGCAVVLQTFFAEAKVCEDDVALRVQQDVLRLQVSV